MVSNSPHQTWLRTAIQAIIQSKASGPAVMASSTMLRIGFGVR